MEAKKNILLQEQPEQTPEYYAGLAALFYENRRRVDAYLEKIGLDATWENRFHVFSKKFYTGFRVIRAIEGVKILRGDGSEYRAYHISEVLTKKMRKNMKYFKLTKMLRERISNLHSDIVDPEGWELL